MPDTLTTALRVLHKISNRDEGGSARDSPRPGLQDCLRAIGSGTMVPLAQTTRPELPLPIAELRRRTGRKIRQQPKKGAGKIPTTRPVIRHRNFFVRARPGAATGSLPLPDPLFRRAKKYLYFLWIIRRRNCQKSSTGSTGGSGRGNSGYKRISGRVRSIIRVPIHAPIYYYPLLPIRTLRTYASLPTLRTRV